MHFEVYNESLCRRFYATPCSFACMYWAGALMTILFIPFFMAYDPNTFWVKTDTYLEQPEVTYNKQLILLAEGFKAGEAFAISFATLAGVNALNHARLRAAMVKSLPSDTNGDGLLDRLMVNVQMPLHDDEEIHSVKMLVFFRTRLRDRAKMEMDTMGFVEHGGILAGSSFHVDGDLLLKQSWPLSVYGGYRYPYVDDPLLDAATLTSADQVLFSSLLERCASRNHTLKFEPTYKLWKRAASYAAVGGGGSGASSRIFNVTSIFRVNRQPVLYTPAVSEVLLAGWIKYFVVLAPVLLLVDALSAFVFRHQVVETKVVSPNLGAGFGRSASLMSR